MVIPSAITDYCAPRKEPLEFARSWYACARSRVSIVMVETKKLRKPKQNLAGVYLYRETSTTTLITSLYYEVIITTTVYSHSRSFVRIVWHSELLSVFAAGLCVLMCLDKIVPRIIVLFASSIRHYSCYDRSTVASQSTFAVAAASSVVNYVVFVFFFCAHCAHLHILYQEREYWISAQYLQYLQNNKYRDYYDGKYGRQPIVLLLCTSSSI